MDGKPPAIFASVGSMLPFDRFVTGIDEWSAANPHVETFIQIGDGAYEPRHARWTRIMPHDEYLARLRACDLFVAHVGIGSIFQALEERKQILMLPRRASLGEHTTEHQLHTADRFRGVAGLRIVDDIAALQQEMTALLSHPLPQAEGIAQFAPEAMTGRIARYLNGMQD